MSLLDLPDDVSVRPAVLHHLPPIREAIEHLGIREIVDRLCPPDPRNQVSDGDCVVAMILNVLHGRVALYGMAERLQGTDTDVLVWDGCPVDAFSDDRLAKALDHLFGAGTDEVFSTVVLRQVQAPDFPHEHVVHGDTTTLALEGAYDDPKMLPGAPRPAYGHSKDFRPDVKQLVYGLSIHGAVGIPLCASMLDGNASDHTFNRLHIDKIAALLPPEDEVTLVADCKAVDQTTLGRARRTGFHYISRLPRSYALHDTLLNVARRAPLPWEEVGRYPGRTKADPERVYRATALTHELRLTDPIDGAQEDVLHRFVLVESSSLAADFDAELPARLERERTSVEAAVQKTARRPFASEGEAEAARTSLLATVDLHAIDVVSVPETRTLPRARRGRPRTGDEAPTETVFRHEIRALSPDPEAIERARYHASHFVLVTDHLDRERWPDRRVFEEYRAQSSVEGHIGFRWLKDVAKVAPVFLKTPHRIAALGLVFLLALLVRNWIEATVRRRLQERRETLPNMNDRPTSRPTAENVFRLFQHVAAVLVQQHGRTVQRLVQQLPADALRALDCLGFGREIFTTPRPRNWTSAGVGS